MNLEKGRIVAGRYRIDVPLARGGFAHVYQATQLNIERTVALKILATSPLDSGNTPRKQEQRFRREARLLGQLQNPHIVTLHDYGVTEEGLLFMAFEYIEGETLKAVISREAPVGEARLKSLLIQSLVALDEVHRMGVLHRDIKPHNIMLQLAPGRQEVLKLLDFGISKRLATTDTLELTHEDTIVGTPRYMSPEQMRGKVLTQSSDLYSLGLIMYELLTGRSPFATQDIIVILGRLFDGPLLLPDWVEVSQEMRALIEQMVQFDPAERPTSCQGILKELGVPLAPAEASPASEHPGAATFPLGLDSEGMIVASRTTIQNLSSISTRPLSQPESPASAALQPTNTLTGPGHHLAQAAEDSPRPGKLSPGLAGLLLCAGVLLVVGLFSFWPQAPTPLVATSSSHPSPGPKALGLGEPSPEASVAIDTARIILNAHVIGAELVAQKTAKSLDKAEGIKESERDKRARKKKVQVKKKPFRPPMY